MLPRSDIESPTSSATNEKGKSVPAAEVSEIDEKAVVSEKTEDIRDEIKISTEEPQMIEVEQIYEEPIKHI